VSPKPVDGELATRNGGRVVVAHLLGSGGQGEVFSLVEPPGLALKRYLDSELARDPSLLQRLSTMVRTPPAVGGAGGSGHGFVAWPTDLVGTRTTFVGYLMPLMDRSKSLPIHRIANPSDARQSASGESRWAKDIDWSYLITAAANLALAVQMLHDADVVIGDFNENNILVWRDGMVTLLDCDSMQISDSSGRHFLCRVGRAEFTPPELLKVNWSETVRAPSSDLFALAVHIHQLILEGEHPFRGVWQEPGEKPTAHDLAVDGLWAYGGEGSLRPRPRAVPVDILPPSICRLFERALIEGATNPRSRPTAREWNEALVGLLTDLATCKTRPRHRYWRELPMCPWCSHDAERTRQIALSPPRPPSSPAAPGLLPSPLSLSSGTPRSAATSAPGKARRRRIPALVTVTLALVLICAGVAIHAAHSAQSTNLADAGDTSGLPYSSVGSGPGSDGPGSGSASTLAPNTTLPSFSPSTTIPGTTAPTEASTPAGPGVAVPSPIGASTTTSSPCPSGSPSASISISNASGGDGPGLWSLTLSGVVTNNLSTAISVYGVNVQLVDASGNQLEGQYLIVGDTGYLNPGQSTEASDPDASVESSSRPSISSVTISWAWAADSQYYDCPDHIGR
jgi:eukaryotic-like serine/threonine-protein kinase